METGIKGFRIMGRIAVGKREVKTRPDHRSKPCESDCKACDLFNQPQQLCGHPNTALWKLCWRSPLRHKPWKSGVLCPKKI